jgi:PAS domain S-box-containing protein
MKKPSNKADLTVESLIGLGNHSARKNYYPELSAKLDELEQERNRYKWLFENALHGIFQAQLDGGILVANPAIVHICGYLSASQLYLEVTDIGEHLFVNPESYAEFRTTLLDQGHVFGYITRFRRRDGNNIYVSMNALLKEENGQRVIEIFVQDITERVLAQEKLQRLNEELEDRVALRTKELENLNTQLRQEITEREQIQQQLKIAKEAAEDANNSKDKYLAAASHDLLQPMNAARLLISTLRERQLADQESHLVERIHMAMENAEDLLADLLDISRLDQNAVTPVITEFDLSQPLHAMISEFQPVADNKGLDLRAVPTRLAVRSDSRLLLRILRNFISNAIRYTHDGRVLVGCRQRGDSLSIQVWDTGDGIPENQQQDIFREFHQLDQHKGKNRHGVGLGLAIVERMAKVLDHQLELRSQQGRGSMFAIEVPVAEQAPQNETAEPTPAFTSNQLEGRRILVIDNDENIRVSMDALLSRWGCNVITAAGEDDAKQRCQALMPEIILADYHLDDDKLGIEAINGLRLNFGQQIPAAIITADRSSHSLGLFKQLGFPVLNKPLKPGKLRALMTHMLREG